MTFALNSAHGHCFFSCSWLPVYSLRARYSCLRVRGHYNLPPNQTLEGFYAGTSVPVNQKLSDMILQLHISERSGRGVPKIVEVYGKDKIQIHENYIQVTLPFERLGDQANVHDEREKVPVKGKNAPVDAPVAAGNVPVESNQTEQILRFCAEAKGIMELAELLGYKDRRSVKRLLDPLLEGGRIARTVPDKPRSKNQNISR